jgi:hypothetical protein
MKSRLVDDECIGGKPKLVKVNVFLTVKILQCVYHWGVVVDTGEFFFYFDEQETTFKGTIIHKMD